MHFARPHEMLQRADGDAPSTVVVRLARDAETHRTTCHAAEMAFFAVPTLVPSFARDADHDVRGT